MGALARIAILLLLVAAAGVVYVAYAPRQAAEAIEPPRARVRVAAEPLVVGTFLTDARAPFEATDPGLVEDDWIVEGEPDPLGAVIIAPVPAGVPTPRSALLAPGQEGFLAAVLRPGYRAVALAVNEVTGAAGLIFPGDRVDLLLTQEIEAADAAAPGRRWASETILRDVRVIAVDQRLGGDLAARGREDEREAAPRTITLEVTSAGAERIAVARNLGSLSLTLRSLIVEGEGAPDDDAAAGPTWAQDVSAATRAASGRAAPTDDGPAPPAISPRVTVMRGGRNEEIAQ